MLIALLAVLGVDLVMAVVSAALALVRRRWLKRQPGEFARVIRVSGGAVEGLSLKWKHGSGRSVRDAMAWSRAPLVFRNELIPVNRPYGEQPAHAGGVKRLGGQRVVEFASGGARIEVAARARHRDLVAGPLTIDMT